MGNRVKLQAYRSVGRPVEVAIDPDATEGAVLGTNVTLSTALTFPDGFTAPAGYTLLPSDLLRLSSTSIQTPVVSTDWSLIQNIPVNVQEVEALAGTGLVTRQSGGNWLVRTLQAGAGASVTNGNGDLGDPTVAHADTSSVADLNSNNSNGVVIQDYAITFDTFGHVQTVTVGTVDLDARYGAGLAAGGTTAQFWRGDKVFTDTLLGTFKAYQNTSAPSYLASQFGAHLAAEGSNSTTLQIDSAGNSPIVFFKQSDGTLATPTNTKAGNAIGYIRARGRGATGFLTSDSAAIGLIATENYTDSAAGCVITFSTISTGTLTASEVMRASSLRNLLVNTTVEGHAGVGTIGLGNAATVPSVNPTGGVVIYAESGAAKCRGTSGTVTTFGPANPHCPKCKSDFVHEWENETRGYGYLAVCMSCFADGRNSHTRVKGEWNE